MEEKQTGIGKIAAGIFAAGATSYIMNWFSLHGVNFEMLGVPSEVVKASLVGTLAGFFVGFTPENVVHKIVEIIYFLRRSFRQIRTAATSADIPPEDET